MQAVDADIRPLDHFRGTRDHALPRDRLDHVRRQARVFREAMLAEAPVLYFRTCDLIRVPYPTRYALRDACSVPTPLVHILNRMFVIQFQGPDGVRTLLANPSDFRMNAETPYFKRVSRSLRYLGGAGEAIVAPAIDTVEAHLARLGLHPADVDYLTYDHLHTQDLRRWLGTAKRPGVFPNARLLIPRQEWDSVQGLLPPQQDWYCPNGTAGIPAERVVLLDQDAMLGQGVALVQTPGHTEGNQSIVVHTDLGLIVTSESGVSADCYAPQHSRIPGFRRYARDTGIDVVLNGNSLEGGLAQYISMVQEREIAGPSPRNPDFPNVLPSSDLAAYWLFPGIAPTFSLGNQAFGTLQAPVR